MPTHILRWTIFTVLLAWLPLLFAAVGAALSGESPSVLQLLSQGDAFLIAAALNCAAIGDLFGTGQRDEKMVLALGGCATALLSVTSFAFAVVRSSETANENVVAILSMIIYGMSAIISLFCRLRVEER